jgi:two-component system response regulator AtoC
MSGMSGDKLLELIKEHSATSECIMILARDDARTALACLKKGAYDYLLKPLTCEELLSLVNRSLERRRLIDLVSVRNQEGPEVDDREAFSSIVAQSEKMKRVMRESELLARSDLPILITGQSGTGKEFLARAIHRASGRAEKPFVAGNMAAISESVFESEFFGHVKGDIREQIVIVQATLRHRMGALFFWMRSEICQWGCRVSSCVLQEKEYMKVGSSAPKKTNTRFIAATHANLERMVERGNFRPDFVLSIEGVLGSYASSEGAQGGCPTPHRPFSCKKQRPYPAGRS